MLSEAMQDLLLLKSAIVNYPVLSERGWVFQKPLLVVVNHQQIKNLTDILLGYNGQVLSGFPRKKDVANALKKANSSAVVYVCTWDTKQEEKLLHSLIEEYRNSVLTGSNTAALLIFSIGYPRCVCLEDFFTLYIPSLTGIDLGTFEAVVPPDETLKTIFERLQEKVVDVNNPDYVALIAAAECLFPKLSTNNRQADYQIILKRAEDLIELNEQNQDLQGLGTLTIKEVFRWSQVQEFSQVFELPNLEMRVCSKLETSIFYDEEFLYFKDTLFKQAVSGLLHLASYEALKAELVEEGILCPDRGTTYTSKMPYVTIAGGYDRIRMLKFKREAFQGTFGGDDFIEQCMKYRRT